MRDYVNYEINYRLITISIGLVKYKWNFQIDKLFVYF